MPNSVPRVCGLCGGVHQKGERCAQMMERDRERKARHDASRPSARKRGYDADWERESKIFLAVFPSCARCGNAANLVHHHTPHKGNKDLFWDRTKWQSLCTPCHSGAAQSEERRNPVRNQNV